MVDQEPDKKPQAGGVKTFSCPGCGGTVGIRAAGISITAICQHCGSSIDIANDNFKILSEAAVQVRTPPIPIGTRGILFGTEWEILGYMVRSDSEAYSWREYLLFNPYQGFRFLVEFNGHWTFVQVLRETIAGGGVTENTWFDDKNYRVFARSSARVDYVLGEFYWRVKVGEKVFTTDYICPPYQLIMENSDNEINWSQGIYVKHHEIEEAFDVKLTRPKGINANQPSWAGIALRNVKWLTVFFICALVMLQIFAVKTSGNQLIYQRQVQAPAIYKGHVVISDPIEIPGGGGNVEIRTQSPVANSWVELDVSLVNTQSQDSYNALQTIEYYYGRDSDGYWSEGGQSTDAVISSVPGGSYQLLIEPDGQAYSSGQPIDFTLNVVRDVPSWSNFWIALLMIILYPLFLILCSWSFEVSRWSQSDFAPAMYRQEGDDGPDFGVADD